jgi:hypothetical protein
MSHGFGDERDTAHEAEGFVEIGEAQFPVQLAVHQAPPGQFGGEVADLFGG